MKFWFQEYIAIMNLEIKTGLPNKVSWGPLRSLWCMFFFLLLTPFMYLFFLKVLIGQSFSAPLSNLIDLIPNDLDLFLCCRMSCVMLCCLCLQTNKIFLMLWMLLKLLTSLACIPCASGTGKKLYFRTLHISCLKLPWHSEICWSLYWTRLQV